MEITKQTQDDFIAAIKSTLDTHTFFQNCKTESFTHHFKGWGIHDSDCRVHIFSLDGYFLVLFEDLGNNHGTSVTNASEQLATEIARLKDLDNEKTTWLECYPHYPEGIRYDLDCINYHYDPVSKKYSQPNWIPIENEIAVNFIKKFLIDQNT